MGVIALNFPRVQIGLDMAGNCKKSNDKDIKNRRERQGFKERIRFEKPLCDLSVTFLALLPCIVYDQFGQDL